MEELQHEKRDSVTLKRNAKGEYAWDIKLYLDAENIGNRTDVLDILEEIDRELRTNFASD